MRKFTLLRNAAQVLWQQVKKTPAPWMSSCSPIRILTSLSIAIPKVQLRLRASWWPKQTGPHFGQELWGQYVRQYMQATLPTAHKWQERTVNHGNYETRMELGVEYFKTHIVQVSGAKSFISMDYIYIYPCVYIYYTIKHIIPTWYSSVIIFEVGICCFLLLPRSCRDRHCPSLSCQPRASRLSTTPETPGGIQTATGHGMSWDVAKKSASREGRN